MEHIQKKKESFNLENRGKTTKMKEQVTQDQIIETVHKLFAKEVDSSVPEEEKASVTMDEFVDLYQELLRLSHESALNNNSVSMTAEIILSMIEKGRELTPTELEDKDRSILYADQLIWEKMTTIMEKMNAIFKECDMNCRFPSLDDVTMLKQTLVKI